MTELIKFLEPDLDILSRRPDIIAGLKDFIPDDCLITDERELVPFETDAFIAYRRLPLAVVLPETTEQVSKLVKYCNDQNVPIIPRGAGTSLAGGAIPQEDAIVIGLSKMNRILEVDLDNRCALVQAGVTNISISQATDADGFFYAPDPSS
jgi:glycolate oxidase